MGRKFVFEKPRTTSITIDILDAEIIRQYKYTGEPLYRTMSRIIKEYAPPEIVEKCKLKLAAQQKNAIARIDRYGQTTQSTLTNDDEKHKPSERYPEGMLKGDYVTMLAEKHKAPKKQAFEYVQRRIKAGTLIEQGGYIVEIITE